MAERQDIFIKSYKDFCSHLNFLLADNEFLDETKSPY